MTAPRDELVLDPTHPATHGAVSFRVEVEDEHIAVLDLSVGFLHRGFEKECESRRFSEAIPYADRLNYQSSVLSSLAYCLAVERLFETPVSERAVWLRTFAGELARIADHLTRLAATADALGLAAAVAYTTSARELIWDALELLTGARVTHHYLRIGGVRGDLTQAADACARSALDRLDDFVGDFERLTSRNRAVLARLRGVASIDRDVCLRYGVTGPILRASGCPRDIRKDEPYLAYRDVDFDVPVGTNGDNADRLLVCIEEVRQSARIALQCLDRLADLAPVDERRLDETRALPAGQCYVPTESANGELGFFIVSNGDEMPHRVRCRAPSFFHAAALSEILRGEAISELSPTFELLNVVSGECDR